MPFGGAERFSEFAHESERFAAADAATAGDDTLRGLQFRSDIVSCGAVLESSVPWHLCRNR
jgi:hypothetical protein